MGYHPNVILLNTKLNGKYGILMKSFSYNKAAQDNRGDSYSSTEALGLPIGFTPALPPHLRGPSWTSRASRVWSTAEHPFSTTSSKFLWQNIYEDK